MEQQTITTEQEPSRAPRKRNPDESKKRIVDAAERAFALRGYDGARLRDIAQEAGVHHALVHHYFTDKRGLFREVLTRGLGRLSVLNEVRFVAGTNLQDSVGRLVAPLFAFFAENRNLLRVIEGGLRDRHAVPFDVASEVLGAQGQPLVAQLEHEIEAAQARGEIRADLTAKALLVYGLSTLLSSFMMGSGLCQAIGLPRPRDVDFESALTQLVDFLTAAFRPAPGQGIPDVTVVSSGGAAAAKPTVAPGVVAMAANQLPNAELPATELTVSSVGGPELPNRRQPNA